MEYIRGNHVKTTTKAGIQAIQADEDLPQGCDALPEELRSQPALKRRQHMKGVAIPVLKDDSELEDLVKKDADSVAGSVADPVKVPAYEDDDVDMLRHSRLTRSRAAMRKTDKIPVHLAMSRSAGSDSDPDIIAPGWSMPLQKIGRKRKVDLSSSDVEETSNTADRATGRKAGPKQSQSPKDAPKTTKNVKAKKPRDDKATGGPKPARSRVNGGTTRI
jgi:hypothetical protein